MNFLIRFRGAALMAVLAMIIFSGIAVTISAQTVEPQNQGRRYGEPGFRGEPINLNVVNADIRDILSYITDQYGINFVIDRSVKETPVTVKVNDVPWNIALDSVLQAQELGVQVNENILRIADNKTLASEGELYRDRQNNQLDTSPLITELVRLNYATTSGAATPGATTSGTSRSAPPSSSGGAMNSGINAASAVGAGGGGGQASGSDGGLMPIIKRRLSRRGSVEIDSRTNSLIITDVAANIAAIKQLIAILDQPEPQVEIEARIVVATRSFSRDIGVQLSAILNGGRGSGIVGGTLPGVTTTLPPSLAPNPSISGDLASKIANTAIGLTTGVFGTAQLSAIISAGEQKGQAKIIATPRVTALNNQTAEIKSSTQIPIVTIQPGTGVGAAVATTEYVDVPLKLEITPQITDQGTVTLTVTAENSSTAAIVGGGAPAINSQSMKTQVVVPDGGTTIIGGVVFDDERDSQDRTPGLASIPILGNLFKRKGVQRNTNEILFFITPRITRPDYAMAPQQGIAPKSGPIVQPVPMGNPPSNSQPAVDTLNPAVMLQSPGVAKPQAGPGTLNK